MIISGYSQNTYPKKIIFNNDTLAALTLDLVKTLNLKLERKLLLEKEVKLYEMERERNKVFINSLKVQIAERDTLILKYKENVIEANNLLIDQNQENTRLKERIETKNKLLKTMLIVTITSLITLFAQ